MEISVTSPVMALVGWIGSHRFGSIRIVDPMLILECRIDPRLVTNVAVEDD
jgi:hypothetical protein